MEKKLLSFFKQYCGTGELIGDNVGSYYGFINGRFDFLTFDEVRGYNAEIIELPELPEDRTYPRVMLVSDDKMTWDKRVVFMEKNGVFLTWALAETLEEAEKILGTTFWKYAKEIEPVQVTLEEIAKWKGIHKEQIIIKQ